MNYFDLFVILILTGILGWQQWFWMHHCQALTDRLMSRDFPEFRRATEHKAQQPIKVQLPKEIPEDLAVLNGFNFR
jgi:hypothetical protein